MLKTFNEMTTHVAAVVRETQVNTLIQRSINLTLGEIWSFYPWSFKRRKTTFSTVASQEDYNLDEEVDEIAFLRQRTTPSKLLYLPDRLFYELQSDPESQSTGIPLYYRTWEETGFTTNLASADTIYVSSSNANDGSSFTVRVLGRNSAGLVVAETLTLNGTTSVTSTTTWAAAGLMYISKSGTTTGTVTCYRTTGATTLASLSPEETAPRSKRISLYPIPSSAITMYLEYFERLRLLVHDTDVPQMDHKWNWVILEGTLSKLWSYKQNEVEAELAQKRYEQGLLLMRQQDERRMDFIPFIRPRVQGDSAVRRTADSVSNAFPTYSLTGW